jgi:hypothetical protein
MRRAIKLVMVVAMAGLVPLAGRAGATSSRTLYLHATAPANTADEASESAALTAGPFMDDTPPTSATPKVATAAVAGNIGFRKNPLLAYWAASAHGVITGTATARLWVGSTIGETVLVRIFGDGGIGVATPIASQSVALAPGPPARVDVTFTGLNAAVTDEIVLQVVTRSARDAAALGPACVNGIDNVECGNGDTVVLFDSVDEPSSLTFALDPFAGGVTPIGFANYPSPSDNTTGLESSIGVDRRTGAVMGLDVTMTDRVIFDDSETPPRPSWRDVSAPHTAVTTLDPILWVDPSTGRTFVAQLAGPAAIFAFSDNDGASWTSVEPPITGPAFDHETVGGGPWAGGPPPTAGLTPYPRALYYCAHVGEVGDFVGGVAALCARSDTGGLTWNPPLPMDFGDCGGLHGHVTVGPDGAVYVPNKKCGDRQGVFISHDNGLTWSLSTVPGTRPGTSDPKVSVDAAGRIYFVASSRAAAEPNKTAVVATSIDGGETWTAPINIGAAAGILNAEQPAIVAGDGGRAAAFFYGTTADGDDQNPKFRGIWHPFVASTFDGGATWTLLDAAPNDPVQRGTICMMGLACSAGRNLLDFQDMTVDAEGRVLVSYADGCTDLGGCNTPTGTADSSTDAHFTIARQTTGKRLYAAFDPTP